MQRDSYLAPDALYLQSQNALEVIELENVKYEKLKVDLENNIVNASSLGDTATSLKNYAEDFCLVLDKAIEANELDKADHETVENAVETIYADKVDIHENLNGAVILTNIETAQSKIQEIDDRISEIESMSLWDSTWHALFGSDSVSDLQSQKEGWEKTLEDFQNKEKRYDSIESVTAGLFNTSEEVRELVWAGLEGIANSFLDGNYNARRDSAWRIDLLREEILEKYGDVVAYLYELKDDSGLRLYSQDKIIYYIKSLEEANSSRLFSLKGINNNDLYYLSTLNEIGKSLLETYKPQNMHVDGEFSEGAFFMYDPTYYNNNEYILSHTNCYSYILGMIYFPEFIECDVQRDTISFFPRYGNQPGLLSGDAIFMQQYSLVDGYDQYINSIFAGTDNANAELIRIVKNDMEVLGFHFEEYDRDMSGGIKVALFVQPNVDMHWYVYDDNADVWYNKHGSELVTNVKVLSRTDAYGNECLEYTDILLEGEKGYEEDFDNGTGYTVFVGEFYIY